MKAMAKIYKSEALADLLSKHRAWLERERHFATLEAAIDRGMADVEAGRGFTSEQVRKELLDRIDQGQKPKQ